MTWWLVSLLGRHGGDYGSKDIQVLHYVICPWRRILNGACISISNLPENIAWQTHKDDLRLEARGPLKSGAWGGRPTCHPQTLPLLDGGDQVTEKLTLCQLWHGRLLTVLVLVWKKPVHFFGESYAEGRWEHSCLAKVNTYTSEMVVPKIQKWYNSYMHTFLQHLIVNA